MKKLLALVLALVMVLGLSVTANAATYSDASSIKYTEAADVMSAIGVFDGMDGKFNPTGTLTREQGAKIITYMLLGKTAADAMNAGSAPFTDVAASRWSAGSIAYCKSLGIIGGRGDGTFDPEGQLSGVAFAKMLLTALGYDASREGFGGEDWQINVAKVVNQIDLVHGLPGLAYTGSITRDEAAQMAFNTLTRDMVDYQGNNLTVDADGNLAAPRRTLENTSYSYISDGSGNTLRGNVSEGGNVGTALTLASGKLQFVENYFPNLKLAYKENELGIQTDYWYTANDRTDYTLTTAKTQVEAEVETNIASYTAATKESVVTADLKGYNLTSVAGGVTMYYNGKDTTTVGNLTAREISKLTGNGTSVKVFANTAKEITKVVVVESYLGKVSKLDSANSEIGIVLQSTRVAGTVISDKGYGTYKIGDYVMVVPEYKTATRNTNGPATAVTLEDDALEIADVTKLEAVQVTAKGSDNATISGTTYKDAANTSTGAAVVTGFNAGDYYDIILDTYGYVVKAEGNVTVNSDYIYVYSVYADTSKGESAYYAYGANKDGLMITLLLDNNHNTLTAAQLDTLNGKMGKTTTFAVTQTSVVDIFWLCAYTTNSSTGISTLLPLDDGSNNATYKMNDTAGVVELKTSTKTLVAGSTYYLTDDTTFVTMTGTSTSNAKASTYKGVRATGSGNTATVSFVYAADGETVLLAFVPRATQVASDDVIYVKSTSKGATLIGSESIDTFTGYLGNDKLSMPSKTNQPGYADDFYTYATDSDGKYTFSEYTTKTVTGATVASVYGTLLTTDGANVNYRKEASQGAGTNVSTAETYDAKNIDGSKILDLTDNGITTMAELANLVKTGGTVYVSFTYDSNSNITMLYIVKAVVTLTAASDTAVKSSGAETQIILDGIKSEYLTAATVTVTDVSDGNKTTTTDATAITDDGTDTTITVSFTTTGAGDKIDANISTSFGYTLTLVQVVTTS